MPLHSCPLHPLCSWTFALLVSSHPLCICTIVPLHPSILVSLHPCTPCALASLTPSHPLLPCALAPLHPDTFVPLHALFKQVQLKCFVKVFLPPASRTTTPCTFRKQKMAFIDPHHEPKIWGQKRPNQPLTS